MVRLARGLYVWVRHNSGCPQTDVFSHRCRCPKQIRGIAPDGEHIRRSANTASWERAEKLRARLEADHDPFLRHKPDSKPQGSKTLTDAVEQFLSAKRGENIVDMAHYEGLFERELLPWCKREGLFDIIELNLEKITKFRNSLNNGPTVKNRKVSRLRTFFTFCRQRHWIIENPAEFLKPAQEPEPQAEYLHSEEFEKLLDSCYVSHHWERGHDFEHRAHRLRAFLLVARWTGLSMIDVVRLRCDRMTQDANDVWVVMLRRQKNGNPVYVAVPASVATAVLALPPMSIQYFFWTGKGKPGTAVRGWRRSLERVYEAANLVRHGKKLRVWTHMLRHTFAIEKLNAGASLEDVSLLLGHRSIKITERHYLRFDKRRQERLTRASMADWAAQPAAAKKKERMGTNIVPMRPKSG
jgi:integrase/recombinase XerD